MSIQYSPWRALGQWRTNSEAGGWSPRDGVGLVNLNGVLFLLGGWNPSWAPTTTNEVWTSTDLGKTWTQLPNAPWERRHSAGYLVHDNKVWVIGGDVLSGHYQNDIWSFDGSVWIQVTSSAAPLATGRVLFQTFSHDGKMWIVGGQTLDDIPSSPAVPIATKTGSPYYDDVWSSTDGITWTLVSTGNLWSPRASIIGNAVKDGYMWLVAGGAYDTQGNARVYKNDVWRSTNGVAWEQVTANGGFPVRQYNCVEVLGEDLVVIAGWANENLADAWASRDGITWRELKSVPWLARHAAGICRNKNELIITGGPLVESIVWSLS
jgi:hypothetical protein